MMREITGGCRCGQLRYRFIQEGPLLNYCCHCLDCQKSTGSAFADQLIVMEASLSSEGRRVERAMPRPSGGVSTHSFCPDCFGRIYNVNSERPGMAIVRGGTLARPVRAYLGAAETRLGRDSRRRSGFRRDARAGKLHGACDGAAAEVINAPCRPLTPSARRASVDATG
jgi:hypothetical protein